MSFFLDKLLSALAFPLGFALSLSLLLFLLAASGWWRRGYAVGAVVIAGLWVVSTPLFAVFALGMLEREFPVKPVSELPGADVAIVLGGGVRPPNRYNRLPDLGESSDRLLHGLRLLKAGKVEKILLVGGGRGWSSEEGSEGGAMASVLADLGVSPSDILIEHRSRNTFENALLAKKLWEREGFRSALLVTSASHMKRALQVFRRRGFEVEPAAIDARAGALEAMLPLSLLPDVRALEQTTVAFKEWLGLLVYRVRGWV